MDKLTIDTPEQVHLEFVLAGVGSRFMAAFLDSLIQLALTLVLVTLVISIAIALGRTRGSSAWAYAAFSLGSFTITWGYYTLFEALWKGQTPGKRWAGIRVIKESGRTITPFEAASRNLLRFVDWLPGFYGAGVVTMLLNAKHRRLGDFVAGTLVVHESGEREAMVSFDAPQPMEGVFPQAARLSLQEANLIETFLGRRIELPADVRRQNGKQIADMVALRLDIPREARPVDDEVFLEQVVREFRNRARLL